MNHYKQRILKICIGSLTGVMILTVVLMSLFSFQGSDTNGATNKAMAHLAGGVLAQETISMPDYFPIDPKIFCRKTYQQSLGGDGTDTAEIIGKITVPYASGPLQGALMCECDEEDLAVWFNDGVTLAILMTGAYYQSADDSLVYPPFPTIPNEIHDGQILPITPGDPSYSVKKDLSDDFPNDTGDSLEFMLFQIRDVTVPAGYYEKAVVVWVIGPEEQEFEELEFYGKDVDLGITPLPSYSEREGYGVDGFIILGLGTGTIAMGEVNYESGELDDFFELVSISCEGPTFDAFDVPGTMETRASGMNDLGQIVGCYLDPSDVRHGLLRDKRGVITTIDFPGAFETWATDVNNRGDVVGFYHYQDGLNHSFVLSKGDFRTLDYPSALETVARGINDRGDIVGFFGSPNNYHGFLYSQGEFRILDYPGSVQTFARGINDRGEIVGQFRYSSGGWHGFLYSQGDFIAFDYPDARNTRARGINDQGDIVGEFRDPSGWHGFLYSKDKGQPVFSTFDVPCATNTFAFKISNRGDVVGHFIDSNNVRYGYEVHFR